MYKIVITRKAKEDLENIKKFGLFRFGKNQTNKYLDLLFNHFKKIKANPFLFPLAYEIKEGYHYCECGSDTIYYKIDNENTIEIVTIIGRQNLLKD